MPFSTQTTPSPKTTQRGPAPDPSFLNETDAALVLDDNGFIDYVSAEARLLLDLGTRPLSNRNFFARIPRSDFGRVARTIHELSNRNDGRAIGLLQLQTGLGPWQWFKVEVTPRRRYEEKAGVVLRLHERGRRPTS
jgi:hypothetical protein